MLFSLNWINEMEIMKCPLIDVNGLSKVLFIPANTEARAALLIFS